MDQRLNPRKVAFFLPLLVLLLQNVFDNMFCLVDVIPPVEGEGGVHVAEVHETVRSELEHHSCFGPS